MCCFLAPLILGTVAAGGMGDRARLRRAARGLVKSGIVAKRKIQAAGDVLAKETRAIVNEARMELDEVRTEERPS